MSVTLGGKTYTIAAAPIRTAAAFRAELKTRAAPLIELIGAANIELNSTADLAAVIERLGPALVDLPDAIADLVFMYSAELRADRDRILDTATDPELMAAFMAILRFAFPFMDWLTTGPPPWANGLARNQDPKI